MWTWIRTITFPSTFWTEPLGDRFLLATVLSPNQRWQITEGNSKHWPLPGKNTYWPTVSSSTTQFWREVQWSLYASSLTPIPLQSCSQSFYFIRTCTAFTHSLLNYNKLNQADSEYKQALTFYIQAMMSQQRNPCTDCKSAQQCTTRRHFLPFPKVICRSVQ